MAKLCELGFINKKDHVSLKDQLVINTLKKVKAEGHLCVDLRRDRKRLIFFCCLCFAPCYGELNLYSHLNGNRHAIMVANAKQTLMKPNPWPFNDGVFFFHGDESEEAGNDLDVSDKAKGKRKMLDSSHEDGNDGTSHELVIPGVLQNNNKSDLVVRRIGVGLISASYIEKNCVSDEIRRIWCEWLGKKDVSSQGASIYDVPEHDFAIVNFPYDYNLGREMIVEDPRYLLASCSYIEAESGNSSAEKAKAVSDPGSSDEDSKSSSNLNSNTLLDGKGDQLVDSQVVLNRADRKRVLDQFAVASERVCSMCMEKFFPRKDVAALLNLRTGMLVCSSRNPTGAFHVFHVSCLVHWILHCEVQMHTNKPDEPVVEERPKKRRKRKCKKNEQNPEAQEPTKRPVFCPDCQGSGINIEVDLDREVFERPTINLHEIFLSKINLILAHQEWLRSPEELENCSTGFTFPIEGDGKHVERLEPLKVLSFYRVAK